MHECLFGCGLQRSAVNSRPGFGTLVSWLRGRITGFGIGKVFRADDRASKLLCGGLLYVGGVCRLRGTDDAPGSFTFTPHGKEFIYLQENVFNRVCSPTTRDWQPQYTS